MQDNTLSGVWIFLSNFQVTLSNATSITMSSFLDIGNGLFTTVTPLGSTAALVSPPLVVGFNETDSTNANADGSFSVTALYHIVAAAGQGVIAQISIQTVPAPLVGAGIPGLAFAFVGLMLWWRRRQHARSNAV